MSSADGVASLPGRLLARHAAQFDIFDLPYEFPDFTLSMAWHARAQHDPADQWLRACSLDVVE